MNEGEWAHESMARARLNVLDQSLAEGVHEWCSVMLPYWSSEAPKARH